MISSADLDKREVSDFDVSDFSDGSGSNDTFLRACSVADNALPAERPFLVPGISEKGRRKKIH